MPVSQQRDTCASGSAPGPRSGSRLRAVHLMPIVPLLVAIWACGHIPISVTHRPLHDLIVHVSVQDPYAASAIAASPSVRLIVSYFEAGNRAGGIPQPVVLPPAAHVTCDGVDLDTDSSSCTVPRRPPDQQYVLTFADDQGNHATVLVPVPPQPVTITQPQTWDTVLIPPAGGFVQVNYLLHMTTPLSHLSLQINALGSSSCVATPGSSAAPCFVDGPVVRQTTVPGTTQATYRIPGDFSSFRAGTGELVVVTLADIAVEQTGFSAASASLDDVDNRAITWSR